MRYIYLKPKLNDLSQGSRIAFARQIRKLTQDEVSNKLGLTDENRRRTMARYENGNRVPTKDRLLEIANILDINLYSIKCYDFKNPLDIIYIFLWLEELYPKININLSISEQFATTTDIKINKFMDEWNEMRQKRKSRKISYEEYIEWKLTFQIEEGD